MGRVRPLLLIGLVCSFVRGSAAQAQDAHEWVVVGASTDADAEDLPTWILTVESALRDAGHRVVPAPTLAARVSERLSAAYSPAPEALVNELSSRVERALELVARGENEQTRAIAEPLLAGAEEHRAALGRAPHTSDDLGNLCLHVVRSYIHERAADRARTAASRCLRLLPDLDPSPRVQDPRVRELFSSVRQHVREGGGAALLIVQLAAGVETNGPCTVRLNGRAIGHTASVRARVPEGDYDVQVECSGVPGRVHRAHVGESDVVQIVIDPELDRAMASEPSQLIYGEALPDEETLISHATRIAESLRAADVMLVTIESGRVFLRRIPTPAEARLPANADRSQVSAAVSAVLSGRSYNADGGDGEKSRPILGPVVLGVVGLAGLGVVIGSVLQTGCVERNDAGFCTVEDRPNPLPLALYGAAGGLALAAAVLWFVLGGSGGDEPEPASTEAGPGHLYVRF